MSPASELGELPRHLAKGMVSERLIRLDEARASSSNQATSLSINVLKACSPDGIGGTDDGRSGPDQKQKSQAAIASDLPPALFLNRPALAFHRAEALTPDAVMSAAMLEPVTPAGSHILGPAAADCYILNLTIDVRDLEDQIVIGGA